MQFKRAQREELARSWNKESWFFNELGLPARQIIARAYGLEVCDPKTRTKCQEDTSLVVGLFARTVGAEKSQVAHALLSGSLKHLEVALRRNGITHSNAHLSKSWQEAFREVNLGDSK